MAEPSRIPAPRGSRLGRWRVRPVRRRRRRAGRRAGHPAAAAHAVGTQADAADRRACRSSSTCCPGSARSGSGTSCSAPATRPRRSADHFGDGSAFGLDIEYVTEDGAARHRRRHPQRRGPVARQTPSMVFNGDILSGRRPFRAAGHPRSETRRRHAASGRVADPAGVRLRADRRAGPGAGLPGEDREPADGPDQRRLLRLPPRGRRGHPGRPRRSRWSGRPFPVCWPTTP